MTADYAVSGVVNSPDRQIWHDTSGLLAAQADAYADMIGQRDRARRWAVQYEQEAAALSERLTQLEGSAYHVEGDGSFHATCLLCGAPWPCPGYGREVE